MALETRSGDSFKRQSINATALVLAVSGALTMAITPRAESASADVAWIIMTTLAGAGVAATQWQTLKLPISNASTWLLVSAAGWLVTALVIILVSPTGELFRGMEDYAPFLVIGCSGGAVVGLLQWLVFWRSYPRGWLWFLSSAIGTIAGTIVGFVVGAAGYVFALVAAVVTGNHSGGGVLWQLFVGALTGASAGAIYGIIIERALGKLVPTVPVEQTESPPRQPKT